VRTLPNLASALLCKVNLRKLWQLAVRELEGDIGQEAVAKWLIAQQTQSLAGWWL
jgi:hypothetical protein